MTYTESIDMTRQGTTLTVLRKRLFETAFWLEQHPEIKSRDPFLTISALAGYVKEAAQKLDFALDQFDSFMYYKTPNYKEINKVIITTPQCTCPLCGGSVSFHTFSWLFRCSKCDQHYGEDKAQYLKGGKELLEAAQRAKRGERKWL